MLQDRHSRDAPSSDDDDSSSPKFPLSEGKGTPLGQLPAVLSTGTRGHASLQLEAALEPLHRLVFGKPGVRGSRRRALEDFRGFPDAFEPDVAAKFARLKKDKLREIVHALGLGFTVSKAQGDLAKEVVAFMMRPSPPAGRAAKASPAAVRAHSATPPPPPAKRPRQTPEEKKALPPAEASDDNNNSNNKNKNSTKMDSNDKKVERSHEGTEATKRPRKEAPVDARAGAPSAPSDDALRVAVYKRVLVMTRAERGSLGMRNLRDEMEKLFNIPAGSLRDRKPIMAETALECVRALVEAEAAAARFAEPAPEGAVYVQSAAAAQFPAHPPTEPSDAGEALL